VVIKPLSTFPLKGRWGPTVFTAPGLTNVARAAVVPLQPRTAAAMGVTLSLAAAAQDWKLLTPTDQAAWATWYGTGLAAYNAFISINQNALAWGAPGLIDTPYLFVSPSIVFATLFAEPDGIHTTLAVAISGPPIAPHECWLRLYVNFQQTTFSTDDSSAKATFFGSFGPLTDGFVNLFDVTDLMAASAGQWWYPTSIDTVSQTRCGNTATCWYWTTDQYGMPSDSVSPQPTVDQFAGIEPVQIGPDFCPTQPGPPYTWPDSNTFYGVPVYMANPFGAPFNLPPAAASLIWVNKGTASAADQANGLLLTAPPTGADSLRCLMNPTAPGTPWSFTVALSPGLIEQNYLACGLVLSDGTKFITLHLFVAGGLNYQVIKWSSPTAASSDYTSALLVNFREQLWLRVSDDGTNLTFGFSPNGTDWTSLPATTKPRTDWFPGGASQVGIFCDPNNGTYGCSALVLSWELT
jgi:hypothetical protein